jgi:hypothetical protein
MEGVAQIMCHTCQNLILLLVEALALSELLRLNLRHSFLKSVLVDKKGQKLFSIILYLYILSIFYLDKVKKNPLEVLALLAGQIKVLRKEWRG